MLQSSMKESVTKCMGILATWNGNLYGLANDEIRLRPLFGIALLHAYANESNEKFNFKNENSENNNLFAVRVYCVLCQLGSIVNASNGD